MPKQQVADKQKDGTGCRQDIVWASGGGQLDGLIKRVPSKIWWRLQRLQSAALAIQLLDPSQATNCFCPKMVPLISRSILEYALYIPRSVGEPSIGCWRFSTTFAASQVSLSHHHMQGPTNISPMAIQVA